MSEKVPATATGQDATQQPNTMGFVPHQGTVAKDQVEVRCTKPWEPVDPFTEYKCVDAQDTLQDIYAMAHVALKDPSEHQSPLSISAVMDVSNVTGNLELAKEALLFLIDELTDRDELSIIAFHRPDTGVAETITPIIVLTKMDVEGKERCKQAAESLGTLDNTTLPGATPATTAPAPHTCRAVLVFTDGSPNGGLTDEAQFKQSLKGDTEDVVVHTFGFGTGHNATMTEDDIDMASGSYYQIEDVDTMQEGFDDCLEGLLCIVAQNLRLSIKADPGFEVIKVMTTFKQETNDDDAVTTVAIKDVSQTEKIDVLVKLKLCSPLAVSSSAAVPLVHFSVQYNSLLSRATETASAQCNVSFLADAQDADEQTKQTIQPSIQGAPLRHWVVTFKNGETFKDFSNWKNRVVLTTTGGNRLVGPIRVVNTDDNTIEIFDDQENRPPLQDETPLTPCDLLIIDSREKNPRDPVTVRKRVVTKVEPKEMFGFVLECWSKHLFSHVATYYELTVKYEYAVKGYGPLSKHSPTGTSTSIRVTSEDQGALTEASDEMFQHCLREQIMQAEKDEYCKLQTESPHRPYWRSKLGIFNIVGLGFSVPVTQSTGVQANTNTDGEVEPEGIACFVTMANATDTPRPLTIFFVEGVSDTDFTKAAMILLKSPDDHLRILPFSGTYGNPPTATMLRQGILGSVKKPEWLGTVDFVLLEDCDLRLLSTKAKPFGMMHRLTLDQAGDDAPTYSHRWRFGRALENYLIPSLTPLALLECNRKRAFELSVEAVCKISTMIFWDSKKGNKLAKNKSAVPMRPWMSGLVATVDQETSTNLIIDFERQLGYRMLKREHSATLKHFKQQLQEFLSEVEKGNCDPAIVKEMLQLVPAAAQETSQVPPSAAEPDQLQGLLLRAYKLQAEQNPTSAPHKALCRIILAQDDVDLMADSDRMKRLDDFLCVLEDEDNAEDAEEDGANVEEAAQLVLEVLGAAPAVLAAEDPANPGLQDLLQGAAKILFKRKHQVGSDPHKVLCRVLFQAQEAYVDLMANPSKGSNENMSQELFLCGHQVIEGGEKCGCQQLLLVGVDTEKDIKKATLGTCSCCGHQAAEHDQRFSMPNAASAGNGEEQRFFAALCTSALLLWDSHEYMKAVRGESRLGGGFKHENGKWDPKALTGSKERIALYRDHLWWLLQEKIDPKTLRQQEQILLKTHYSKMLKNDHLAGEAVLQKLCRLRELQRTEVCALIGRLHVDESAAVKKPVLEEKRRKKEKADKEKKEEERKKKKKKKEEEEKAPTAGGGS